MSACVNELNVRSEGDCENGRNRAGKEIFSAIIREAYKVEDVICGHHIIYEAAQKGSNGFVYHDPQEIPSADALIFNHDVAKVIWGKDYYLAALRRLAVEPVETRDALLQRMYNNRNTLRYSYGGDEVPTWSANE